MTTIGFQLSPPAATATMEKNGTTQTIQTRLQVMSGMEEFENYSLEELRIWDYGQLAMIKINERDRPKERPPKKQNMFSKGVALIPNDGPVEFDSIGTPHSYAMMSTGLVGISCMTKIHCLSDMPEFELRSMEELRFNDYRLLGRITTRNKKFTYPKGTEEEVVLGEQLVFSTQLVCITAIKEYEDFSLEELRYTDNLDQQIVEKLEHEVQEYLERIPTPTDTSNWPRPTKGFYFSFTESEDSNVRCPKEEGYHEHFEKGSDCVADYFEGNIILNNESVPTVDKGEVRELIEKSSDYSSDSSESL